MDRVSFASLWFLMMTDEDRRPSSRYTYPRLAVVVGSGQERASRLRVCQAGKKVDETRKTILEVLGRDAQQGIDLPDGSCAWSTIQCLQILRAMGSTKIVVLGGEFFRTEPIGLVPAYDGWSCERAPGENATDFALRSRALATDQVTIEAHVGFHVVLELSDQRHAA